MPAARWRPAPSSSGSDRQGLTKAHVTTRAASRNLYDARPSRVGTPSRTTTVCVAGSTSTTWPPNPWAAYRSAGAPGASCLHLGLARRHVGVGLVQRCADRALAVEPPQQPVGGVQLLGGCAHGPVDPAGRHHLDALPLPLLGEELSEPRQVGAGRLEPEGRVGRLAAPVGGHPRVRHPERGEQSLLGEGRRAPRPSRRGSPGRGSGSRRCCRPTPCRAGAAGPAPRRTHSGPAPRAARRSRPAWSTRGRCRWRGGCGRSRARSPCRATPGRRSPPGRRSTRAPSPSAMPTRVLVTDFVTEKTSRGSVALEPCQYHSPTTCPSRATRKHVDPARSASAASSSSRAGSKPRSAGSVVGRRARDGSAVAASDGVGDGGRRGRRRILAAPGEQDQPAGRTRREPSPHGPRLGAVDRLRSRRLGEQLAQCGADVGRGPARAVVARRDRAPSRSRR